MAATTQCPSCSAAVAAKAQFCPRCGAAVHPPPREHAGPAPAAADPEPPVQNLATVKSGVPAVALLFLVGLVLGPAAIIGGLVWGSSVLLYGGIAVSVLVVLLLLLGMFF